MGDDIELVIKIDKKLVVWIHEYFDIIRILNGEKIGMIADAIAKGTPLPKWHGDLKDMDDIYEALEGWDDDTSWIVDAIDCQAPTILEADATESEEV